MPACDAALRRGGEPLRAAQASRSCSPSSSTAAPTAIRRWTARSACAGELRRRELRHACSSRARSATRSADRGGARLAPARGRRPGRRGHEPLRRRRLPDDDVRRAGGRVADTKLGNLTEERAAPAGRARSADGARAERGLGRAGARRGVPRARARPRPVEARPRPTPAGGEAAPARARRPLHRRQGGAHAPGPGALGLPRVLAAGRRGPGHRPHAGGARSRSSACGTAACESENLLDDALTIAIAETGVPVIALDADRLEGDLGLRLARAGRAARRSCARCRRARSWSPTTRGPSPIVLGEVSQERRRDPDDRAHAALRAAREGRAADRRRGGALDRGGDALVCR